MDSVITCYMSGSEQVFELVSGLVSSHTEKTRIRLVSSAESMVDSVIFGLPRPSLKYWTRYTPTINPLLGVLPSSIFQIRLSSLSVPFSRSTRKIYRVVKRIEKRRFSFGRFAFRAWDSLELAAVTSPPSIPKTKFVHIPWVCTRSPSPHPSDSPSSQRPLIHPFVYVV